MSKLFQSILTIICISGITGLGCCVKAFTSHHWTLPYFSISYVIKRFGSFFMPKICQDKFPQYKTKNSTTQRILLWIFNRCMRPGLHPWLSAGSLRQEEKELPWVMSEVLKVVHVYYSRGKTQSGMEMSCFSWEKNTRLLCAMKGKARFWIGLHYIEMKEIFCILLYFVICSSPALFGNNWTF